MKLKLEPILAGVIVLVVATPTVIKAELNSTGQRNSLALVQEQPQRQQNSLPDATSCTPTQPDVMGPFYVPGAPVRSSIGKGHVLEGRVMSSADCLAIPNAQIEFWLANLEGVYDDDHRATMFADASGSYQFESNVPSPYTSRPSHIHIRVSVKGYQTLITQYYPKDDQIEGSFNLVLVPSSKES